MSQLLISAYGDRVLKFHRLPESPALYAKVIDTLLRARKYCLRYFCLPRPSFLSRKFIDDAPDSVDIRHNMVDYLTQPWYIKPSFWTRWGPGAWISHLFGFKLPGDDGDKYIPQGYVFSEVGPRALSGKGIHEMDETMHSLIQRGHGGCPFR